MMKGKTNMSIVSIKNEWITIGVNTHGAELVSLKSNETGKEYMWCGDSKYWGRVSPVLFPFVGKLEGQRYTHKGVTYENIPQHGFARDSEFELVEQTENTLWFALIKDEKWEANYPFDFTLRLGYRLENQSVHVMWTVINDGTQELHFSIGAHPAFTCEGGLNGYSLDLHTNLEALPCGVLTQKGVLGEKVVMNKLEQGVLPLTDELFDEDALIIDGKGLNTVTIRDKNQNPFLQLRFDAPQLGIWSPVKAHAPFVCIEPWFGRSDREGFAGTLAEREYSNSLESGHSFAKEYVIEIL